MAPGEQGAAERSIEPAPEVVVSWFESEGSLSCAWMQIAIPDRKPKRIARIPFDCAEPQVSFGPENAVLVTDTPVGSRFWHVTPGSATPLPSPPRGSADSFGFSKTGDIVMLSRLPIGGSSGFPLAPDKSVKIDGMIVPGVDYSHDGEPGIAESWKLTEGAWVRMHTQQTDYGWNLARGVDFLPVDLSPTAGSLRFPSVEGPAPPSSAQQLPTEVGHVEFTVSDPVSDGQRPGRILPARIGERIFEADNETGIALIAQGPWLLVEPDGGPVELVDLRTYETVWSSSNARATTFWPPRDPG